MLRFSTYEECISELWFLLNCDITNIASNFLKTLRKSKYDIKYYIDNNKMVVGLNDYNQDIWLKNKIIHQIGKNNSGIYI